MKHFRVDFFGGPINVAVRYYDTLSIARRVARRYVYILYDSLVTPRYCEISFVNDFGFPKLLEYVIHD